MKFALLLVTISAFLFAQPGWQTQHPFPTGSHLNSIHVFDQNTAIVTGGNIILKTTDGGTTWKTNSASMQYTYSIKFYNNSLGFVIGNEILKTTDGGETWTKLTVNTPLSIYCSIKIFSPDSIYIGGISAANVLSVVKTTDGGTTWSSKSVAPITGASSGWCPMFVANAKYMWICHPKDGSVWKSTDAGENWNKSATGAGVSLGDIMFKDTTNGLLTSELGMYSTSDGGTTWSAKTVAGSAGGRFAFLDAANGWVRGSSLSKTTNGGTTWTAVGNLPSGVMNIQFSSITQGIVVGTNGLISKTTDGGVTWTNKNSSLSTMSCVDVQFFNADTGWVVTQNEFLKTTNGGKVWSKPATFTGTSIYAFHFNNSQNGWIVGNVLGGASALKTVNGGQAWDFSPVGLAKTMYDVHFFDVNNGCIAADSGYVLSTSNAGATWSRNHVGTFRAITNIWMTSALQVICTDDKGGIYLSADGGKTWVNKLAPFATSITSLFMLNSNEGWVTFGSYVASKTTDGGNTWKSTSIGIENLRDIQFLSSNVGYACSQNSSVYVTTDGGTTWTKTAGPTGILALYFVNQNVGFAVGPSGLIAKTVNGSGVLAVNEKKSGNIPGLFLLEQNYPNPFNPTTEVKYQLPTSGLVTLRIFDMVGKEVATLVNEEQKAGLYSVKFNGGNLSSGVYFYRLQSGSINETKRMVLLK